MHQTGSQAGGVDAEPRKGNPAPVAVGTAAGPCEPVPVREHEATIEARRGLENQGHPAALEGAFQMLEMTGNVVLWNADELRQIARGHRTFAKRLLKPLAHGALPCRKWGRSPRHTA